MNFDAPASLLNISQAGKMLGVHPDTLRRWERQGKLKPVRVGSRLDRRYRVQELLSMVTPDSHSVLIDIDKAKKIQEQSNAEVLAAINRAKWIFFDVGYTLAGLFPSRGDIYADIAYSNGYKVDPFAVDRFFDQNQQEWDRNKIWSQPLTKASDETIARYYSGFNAEVLVSSGIPRSNFEVARIIGRKIYEVVYRDKNVWRTFSHTEPLLKGLIRQGKHLAVVENWSKSLPDLLEAWGIREYFSFVICGGVHKLRKPDPAIFTMALKNAGVSPKDVIYIGDSYTDDVLGPQEVHIKPILYDRRRSNTAKKCLKIYTFEHILSSLNTR